jgi:hypothetical protein
MTSRKIAAFALLAMLGVAFTAQVANAYSNCTTNCSSYGGQTTCTRSCF